MTTAKILDVGFGYPGVNFEPTIRVDLNDSMKFEVPINFPCDPDAVANALIQLLIVIRGHYKLQPTEENDDV